VLLVLWDVDGTLVHTGGHGRYAFEEAYEVVVGRPFDQSVPYAGRTDRQIALSMLAGQHDHLPRVLEELELATTSSTRCSPATSPRTPLSR
jgi:phosphoglycolate phosphatase-like HAD superfamily hydrolase